jgi:hypothetical protein
VYDAIADRVFPRLKGYDVLLLEYDDEPGYQAHAASGHSSALRSSARYRNGTVESARSTKRSTSERSYAREVPLRGTAVLQADGR